MRENRGPWYLFTGLIIGAVLGLVYAWRIDPVEYVNTNPSSLRAEFKEEYRFLIASAYIANGDLERARARLALLGDADPAKELTLQAQRALTSGRLQKDVQAIGLLAVAFSQGAAFTPPAGAVTTSAGPAPASTPTPPPPTLTNPPAPPPTNPPDTPQPATATPTTGSQPEGTPRVTFTPLPTLTATATPGTPYVLETRTQVCQAGLLAPLLMVEAQDGSGAPVAGVEVVVIWPGGEEHFFTGLKSEVSSGYADFEMSPGVSYSVYLGDGGQTVTGITPYECQAPSGERTLGSWRLIFQQP